MMFKTRYKITSMFNKTIPTLIVVLFFSLFSLEGLAASSVADDFSADSTYTAAKVQMNKELLAVPQNVLTFLQDQHEKQYQLKPAFSRKLAGLYLKAYFSPWLSPRADKNITQLRDAEKLEIQQVHMHPGYDDNGYRHRISWFDALEKQINLQKFPNINARGVIIHATALRAMPTQLPYYMNPKHAGEGYPFDYFQDATLSAGTPLHIWQITRNGQWYFVTAGFKEHGWVKAENLAFVKSALEEKWLHYKHWITPLKDRLTVINAQGHFYFMARLGGIYPLLSRHKVHDQIAVLTANDAGEAQIQSAMISAAHVAKWPLMMTSKAIARQANQFLGQAYGWGGSRGRRDCSETTKDLFSAFGLALPRTSTDQQLLPGTISIAGLNSKEKQQAMVKQAIPLFSLIGMHGHIMLYVGAIRGRVFVLQAPWGLHNVVGMQHKDGRIVIGRTVLSPLDMGKDISNVPLTSLDRTQTIVPLVPRQQLLALSH